MARERSRYRSTWKKLTTVLITDKIRLAKINILGPKYTSAKSFWEIRSRNKSAGKGGIKMDCAEHLSSLILCTCSYIIQLYG